MRLATALLGGAARACCSTAAALTGARDWALRARAADARKAFVTLAVDAPRTVSETDVFVTQEVDMRAIKWFGMNYNHSLCVWRPEALKRIYELAAAHLVSARHYPDSILRLAYEPDFLIRGVSLDTHRGVLMKLTFLHQITPSTAYFGRRCLSYDDIVRIYGGLHVSGRELRTHFRHMIDPFSVVTATLTADVLQSFADCGASFHPSYVYQDVVSAIAFLGRGTFAAEVAAAPGEYIADAPHLYAMLKSLRDAGRKLLLLTNSDFRFVDVGMRHMLRDQLPEPAAWPALFDVVVVNAQRPNFFTLDAPFRSLNTTTHKIRWLPVRDLRAGQVYCGGSFAELNRLVPGGMSGQDVLYMTSLSNPGAYAGGDPYEDLSVPSTIGWRTGAVVAEVEREVRAQAHPRYRAALAQLLAVERAARREQDGIGAPWDATATLGVRQSSAAVGQAGAGDAPPLDRLLDLRDELKTMLNPRFGSCFRTLTGPTLFAHNLLRFSDVYTGRLENLLALAPDHFLFPLRRALPHEPWGGSQ